MATLLNLIKSHQYISQFARRAQYSNTGSFVVLRIYVCGLTRVHHPGMAPMYDTCMTYLIITIYIAIDNTFNGIQSCPPYMTITRNDHWSLFKR